MTEDTLTPTSEEPLEDREDSKNEQATAIFDQLCRMQAWLILHYGIPFSEVKSRIGREVVEEGNRRGFGDRQTGTTVGFTRQNIGYIRNKEEKESGDSPPVTASSIAAYESLLLILHDLGECTPGQIFDEARRRQLGYWRRKSNSPDDSLSMELIEHALGELIRRGDAIEEGGRYRFNPDRGNHWPETEGEHHRLVLAKFLDVLQTTLASLGGLPDREHPTSRQVATPSGLASMTRDTIALESCSPEVIEELTATVQDFLRSRHQPGGTCLVKAVTSIQMTKLAHDEDED